MFKSFVVIALLLLTGCAGAPKQTASTPLTASTPPNINKEQLIQNKQKQLLALQHWQAEGRIAAKHGQKGGNASFVWEQTGENYQIKLFGPFGSGAVYISGHPNAVELKEANGKVTTAQSPELLMQKKVGWKVPITGLRDWLKGSPVTTEKFSGQQYDQNGNLTELRQQGWQMDYSNYQSSAPALPSKITLINGDVKIKMVVNTWKKLP